jgi:hypothetical protein
VLDFDATDHPLHGQQEGRFFHGYYDSYCYLPLYVFRGQQLLCAYLRGPATLMGRTTRGHLEAAGLVNCRLRRSAMQRAVASIKPSLRSSWPSSIMPPSLLMLPPSKQPKRSNSIAPTSIFSVQFGFGMARSLDPDSIPRSSGIQGGAVLASDLLR